MYTSVHEIVETVEVKQLFRGKKKLLYLNQFIIEYSLLSQSCPLTFCTADYHDC